MKLMWTGSDVLFATKFLKHSKKSKWFYMAGMRLFAKIADIFVQQHYVVSEHLIPELSPLKLKKPIYVLVDPPLHIHKYPKIEHKGLNFLYYRPKGSNQPFLDWVYGYDIYKQFQRTLSDMNINWFVVDGTDDLSKLYPLIDFYIRPNRHDGNPRMIMECEINNIPYYWSKSNPNLNDMLNECKNINSLRS